MEETPKALRVALVEDDPRIQQLICAEITDEGHECQRFDSAEDFLTAVSSDRFDLVLLDLMLPGMDGLTCLKQLQIKAAPEPALRVVIVTALNDADKQREAFSYGAEAYVLKPDLFEQLPQLLQARSMP
ncbi:MAG: response regulator [Synechococcus sp. BS301-5m-G53]|nr:response regulator [Synechococcus sp. BS301-5m-G53]